MRCWRVGQYLTIAHDRKDEDAAEAVEGRVGVVVKDRAKVLVWWCWYVRTWQKDMAALFVGRGTLLISRYLSIEHRE